MTWPNFPEAFQPRRRECNDDLHARPEPWRQDNRQPGELALTIRKLQHVKRKIILIIGLYVHDERTRFDYQF